MAIFVGVTLGFLADDFRDFRENRRLERESLTQVLQDLALDHDDVRPMLEQADHLIDSSRQLTNHAASGNLPGDSVSTLVDALLQATTFSYEPATSAYTGLRTTGRIDLIRDADLRRDLVHYFEDRQPAVLGLNNDWRDQFGRWLEAASTHVDVLETDPSIPFPRFAVPNPDALMTDREFLWLTAELGGRSYPVLINVEELLALNEALRAEISDYLSRE